MYIVGRTGSNVAITTFHRFERTTSRSGNLEKESCFLIIMEL